MTETNMQKYSKDKLLLGLATRLKANPKFMANVLYEYQKQEKLTQSDFIDRLAISLEQFTQLALCKRPDAEAENFALQIHKISSATGINVNVIVGIIRQVDSLEALLHHPNPQETTTQNRQTIPNLGALAAARDREADGEASEDAENDSGANTEGTPE